MRSIPQKRCSTRLRTSSLKACERRISLISNERRGNVFQGFTEGILNFPPTYKYQPGTDVYETRPEKKLRAPAWCDRVLWRCERIGMVKLRTYRSAPLDPSDHKPVSALFECELRSIVEEHQQV